MAMNRITLSLFSLAAFALPACEPLFVDFDGYREYPPDSGSGGSGNGGSGNGGSGNGGSANGASGGDAGSAAGGSGDPGGNGGAAAGGSGGDAGSGNGGSGNAAGNGGDAGNGGGGGCAPENPQPVCGPNMNCEFRSLIPPYDYSTECIPAGTGTGVNGCQNSDSTLCTPEHLCFGGQTCYRWCRLGTNDCAVCGGGACEAIINPTPTRGSTQYGLCGRVPC